MISLENDRCPSLKRKLAILEIIEKKEKDPSFI